MYPIADVIDNDFNIMNYVNYENINLFNFGDNLVKLVQIVFV